MYDLERELAAINNEIKNIAAQGDVVEVCGEETLAIQVKILNFCCSLAWSNIHFCVIDAFTPVQVNPKSV